MILVVGASIPSGKLPDGAGRLPGLPKLVASETIHDVMSATVLNARTMLRLASSILKELYL